MNGRVVFSPEALEQLAEFYRYIAEAASPDVAARYTEAIVSDCESLRTFPLRGTQRDDVRPGFTDRGGPAGRGRLAAAPPRSGPCTSR
jgi:plasmid stabilization system protein ParE